MSKYSSERQRWTRVSGRCRGCVIYHRGTWWTCLFWRGGERDGKGEGKEELEMIIEYLKSSERCFQVLRDGGDLLSDFSQHSHLHFFKT